MGDEGPDDSDCAGGDVEEGGGLGAEAEGADQGGGVGGDDT